MRRTLKFPVVLAMLFAPVLTAAQQKTKPWIEWSKNEAEKVLTDSPWAKTQVDTNLAEMFYTPTSQNRNAPNSGTRLEEGATNQEVNVKYHIRFFSARPVRQALARLYELQQKLESPTTERLHKFAELESTSSIILTVTFEGSDQRASGKIMQAFNSAVTGTLKNKTYLERNDGKRLFLEEYVLPGRDGFGARFIFPRTLDGLPFILTDVGEVRFYSELASTTKLNVRFKIADMMYQGKLEY